MATTGIPSIGDVLLLSQLAWRIGYAFTAARPSAPPEFLDVETELKTLTKALDLLAEALDDDDSILVRADERVKAGVNKSLLNCQQSLEDLNAFVVRYQEVRKPEGEVGTRGIHGVKTWKVLLLKSWRSVWWTTEGGDIQFESIVLQLDEIHGLASGTITARMDGIDHLMADMVSQIGSKVDSPKYSQRELVNTAPDQPSSSDDLTSYDPSSHTRESSPGESSDGYLVESNTKFSVEVTQKYSPSTIR
ncbi:MAG: hypothetical protein M1840_008561 [Geoglossum simile]|nr:MAG: hypothetical protein M1840_008561 [Geoglossum simile]